jgi:hypothetical protein
MYVHIYGWFNQQDIWSCCPYSLCANNSEEEIYLGVGSDERVLSHLLTCSLVPSYCIVHHNPSIVLGTPQHPYYLCALPGSSIFSPPETHPPACSTVKQMRIILLAGFFIRPYRALLPFD